MSAGQDRITVPTNGRGPHPIADTVDQGGVPTTEEMSVAFSPKQLAIGLGIIASLVLLIAGRARRRRPDDD
jgi:hypothetical protein